MHATFVLKKRRINIVRIQVNQTSHSFLRRVKAANREPDTTANPYWVSGRWKMQEESTDDRGVQYWRDRYYDSVEKHDLQEKAHAQNEQILKRGLLRLAVAVENNDARLQSELKELRGALYDNAPAHTLDTHFDRMGAVLVLIDEENATHRVHGVTLGTVLGTLLNELPAPQDPSGRKALIQLQRQVQDVQEVESLRMLVPSIAAYLRKLIITPTASPHSSPSESTLPVQHDNELTNTVPISLSAKPSLVARLFGDYRRNKQADVRRRSVLPNTPLEMLPAHIVLIKLLERLPVSKHLGSMRDRLVAQLADGFLADDLAMVLDNVMNLIEQMLSKLEEEKQDLQRFLVQTTEHLGQMGQFVRGTEATRFESRQEGIRLQAIMHAQVQDISTDMERVTDVHQLKSVVRAHLNTVDDHLKTYRDTEENRHKAAEHEVLTLRARMKDLEREVNNLRERIAIAHSEAIKDPLTGIFNRQAYNERLSQEYARWKRYQAPLTLVIWDIDNFKHINDTYGHQAGDVVLRHVAKLISSALRETDFVARYGGEEFVALMPETMIDRALEPAEKIRALVSNQPIKYAGRDIPVTLSAGMAQFEDGDFPDHVFRRADVALYKSKMGGKNRVCVEPRTQMEKTD